MSRYTYSQDKTVRCVRDPFCHTEYEFERFDRNSYRFMRLGGGWGNSKKGYYHDKTKLEATTLVGLLDLIAEEK